MTRTQRPALSPAELVESVEAATAALRTVGYPGIPFGSDTRIGEAHLLRALEALLTEVGTQLRAREIVTDAHVAALTTRTRRLAEVLAGPDIECTCNRVHDGAGDHRSDGCAWTHDERGTGCSCDQRSGRAPIATRVWLEPATPVNGPF